MTSMMTPKWLGLLAGAVNENPKAKIYACATIDHDVPRVRHLVHRSLLSTTTARPLLVSTTDVRTPKVSQLYSSGCAAELAWWIDEEQYRITANAYVMPTSGNDLHGRFPFEKLIGECCQKEEDIVKWWEKERINTFDNKMGDVLRASFVRPIPGSRLLGGYESAKEWPERLPRSADVVEGTKEAEKVTEALNNFALLVFQPFNVERIELGIFPNRRTSWEWKDDNGWEESILVP